MKGRNWEYRIARGWWLLRNVNSVVDEYDGWFIDSPWAVYKIQPKTALDILKELHRQGNSDVYGY